MLLLLLLLPTLQITPRLLHPPRLTRQIRHPSTILARIPPTQRARLRHRRLARLAHGCHALLERRQQRLGGLGRQVLVVVVVDLHHGSVDAGAETFYFDEGEEAVFGGFALLDAEVLFDGFDDGVAAAAAELAWCLGE